MIEWLEKMLDRKADSERGKYSDWVDSIKKKNHEWNDKNTEEWICTVRVLAAPGWSGKMTLGELADLCGTARNKDEKVPMRRVK